LRSRRALILFKTNCTWPLSRPTIPKTGGQ